MRAGPFLSHAPRPQGQVFSKKAFFGTCHRCEVFSNQKPSNESRHQRTSRQRQFHCQATTSVNDKATVESAKDEIASLAGPKNGTDRSPDVKSRIAAVAGDLSKLQQMNVIDMTGSKWKLVFTESLASSAGKLGPFVGKVVQEFPADRPGVYINWLYLGPATISLLADYKQSSKERIDVSFKYLQVELGIWKWKKDLTAKGTWDSVYIDDSYRVFKANEKNLFVLEKLP